MRPGARAQAAIDILDRFEAGLTTGKARPLYEDIVRYFRGRRYAGAKDRRAVGEMAFAVLRDRLGLLARLKAVGVGPSARLMLAASLEKPQDVFTGEHHAPAALTGTEEQVLKTARTAGIPEADQLNVPGWALEALKTRFGNGWQAEARAMQDHAPFTLRINTLKAGRGKVKAILADNGVTATDTRWSALGLRLPSGTRLGRHPVLETGLADIQDEAGQIAAALVGARRGEQVADLCAGAGGKALALAAAMGGKGQIHAFDTNAARMDDLLPRAGRAIAHNIQTHELPRNGAERAEALAAYNGQMDRVVIDAPCSGTGTWWRHPDLRFRTNIKRVEEFSNVQDKLLEEGAKLVKLGGCMAYMTCSWLPRENEDRVERFLKDNAGWVIGNYAECSAEGIAEMPSSTSPLGGALQLSPAAHGTDGFFVCLLRRTDR